MELQQVASIAGTVGGALGVLAFFPQAYRIVQRRSARDVSLSMYVAIITGCALWMFYSYVYGLVALFVTNAAITIVALVIAVLRLRYGREGGTHGTLAGNSHVATQRGSGLSGTGAFRGRRGRVGRS